ncbi:MAG: hypothetical protein ACU84Q_19980 [Gammaproteobacteria bacterium]
MLRRLIFNRYLGIVVISIFGTLWVSSYFHSMQRPNLQRLFRESKRVTNRPPVIFIHGELGSELRDKQSGEQVWFSSPVKLIVDEFKHLPFDIDPASL